MRLWARMLRPAVGVAIAGSLLAAAPAAAVNYAAPGSTVVTGDCPESNPCQIHYAVSSASAGEEIQLLPGNYGVPGSPLTPKLMVDNGKHLRGKPGGARPKLYFEIAPFQTALDLIANAKVSDLEVENAMGQTLFLGAATGERLIVRSGGASSSACGVYDSILRDSACFSTGSGGFAATTASSGDVDATLRNVTARASGPGSSGYFVGAGDLTGPTLVAANVRNSILRGAGQDLFISASDLAEQNATARLTIGNSSFDTRELVAAGGNVAQLIEEPAGSNQAAPPALEADGITQAAGSPTIDAGAALADLGATDIFGGPRVLGLAPDIGADEFLPPVVEPPVEPPVDPAPSIGSASLSRKVFRIARSATPRVAAQRRRTPAGTKIRYSLSEPASVRIAIKRRAPGRRLKGKCVKPRRSLRRARRCTRWVAAGSLRRQSPAGATTVPFSGRVGRKALKPGRYRFELRATDMAGQASALRRLSFRIVRR